MTHQNEAENRAAERAKWEAPEIREYDAKAEILGGSGLPPVESFGALAS